MIVDEVSASVFVSSTLSATTLLRQHDLKNTVGPFVFNIKGTTAGPQYSSPYFHDHVQPVF